jgi:hypothetical protein
MGSLQQNSPHEYESTANTETMQLKLLGDDNGDRGDLLCKSKPTVNKIYVKITVSKIPLRVRKPTSCRIQPSEQNGVMSLEP